MTKQEMNGLLLTMTETSKQIKSAVKECLKRIGRPVSFDYENSNAPSVISMNFQDDVADCYITKIYLDGDIVKVNLYAYYAQAYQEDILLENEPNSDWGDILSYLMDEIEED